MTGGFLTSFFSFEFTFLMITRWRKINYVGVIYYFCFCFFFFFVENSHDFGKFQVFVFDDYNDALELGKYFRPLLHYELKIFKRP